jgi:hypothetical protein
LFLGANYYLRYRQTLIYFNDFGLSGLATMLLRAYQGPSWTAIYIMAGLLSFICMFKEGSNLKNSRKEATSRSLQITRHDNT